jgi:uncharacterized protein with von Willebrand factor type A (vWA) domain
MRNLGFGIDRGVRASPVRGTPGASVGCSVAREAVVVTLFALTYGGVRELKEGIATAATRNADHLERFEHAFDLGWEHAFQSFVLGPRRLGRCRAPRRQPRPGRARQRTRTVRTSALSGPSVWRFISSDDCTLTARSL